MSRGTIALDYLDERGREAIVKQPSLKSIRSGAVHHEPEARAGPGGAHGLQPGAPAHEGAA